MKLQNFGANRDRVSRGHHLLVGLGAAFVIGILTVWATGTAAASPASGGAAVRYEAPYSGTVDLSFGSQGSGCHQSAHFPVPATFNLSTGIGNASEQSSARSCGTANSTGQAVSFFGLLSGSFSAHSGVNHLKAVWAVNFTVHLSSTPGGSGQMAAAWFWVVGFILVHDLTNNTYFFPTWSGYVYYGIFTGVYSHAYKAHISTFLNATLSPHHSYTFETQIEDITVAFVWPGASAAYASMNMGTGGRDAVLVSYTL